MTSPYEILTKAQELIRDPKHWTTRHFAKDENGVPTSMFDEKAYCFCSIGAIERVVSLQRDFNYDKAFFCLRKVVAPFSVGSFNDHRTHQEVMAAFDKARELAKGH